MIPSSDPAPVVKPAGPSAGRRVLAVVMTLPAFLCCALTQAVPLMQTVLNSLLDLNALNGESRFVGGEAYVDVLSDPRVLKSAGNSLLWVIVRIAAVALVPPMVGWATGALGNRVRTGSAVLLSIGWSLATPAVLVLFAATVSRQLQREGLLGISEPGALMGWALGVDFVATLVAATGLGVLAYGGAAGSARQRRMFAGLWLVSVLVAIGSGLQEVVWPLLMTNGNFGTSTLGLDSLRLSFQMMEFGRASALHTLIAVPVVLAGTLSVVIVALLRPRLGTGPVEAGPRRGLAWALLLIAGGLTLIAVVALTGLYVSGLNSGNEFELPSSLSLPEMVVTTAAPPLISTLIQVPVALLAAIGIGRLRPLGERSLWLLIPFGPFLLLGFLPLSVAWFQNLRTLGLLGEWATSIDLSLNVGLLVLLSVYFFGPARHQPVWLTAGVIVAALVGVYQAGISDLVRQYVLINPSSPSLLITLLQLIGARGNDFTPVPALVLSVPFIFLWLPLTGLVLARLRIVEEDPT